MVCPHCNAEDELDILESYTNMYSWVKCPACNESIWLYYEEECLEDYSDCWDLWVALKTENYRWPHQ